MIYSKGKRVGYQNVDTAANVIKSPKGGFDVVHDTSGEILSHHENRPDADLERIKVHKRNQVPLSKQDQTKLDNSKD